LRERERHNQQDDRAADAEVESAEAHSTSAETAAAAAAVVFDDVVALPSFLPVHARLP
jgi:hypothetical protein